ncbi:MAG: bifunctional hydroxymethylpyrimidine kinase/phosphomethylpyrimidine kinase, partial [Thermoguttaceae bacterium]|nr:bifunctional hydroxymethylpyrimidine kinase/phosphomethylpyrimidine kinase [Thermoguttaceae bacterium]
QTDSMFYKGNNPENYIKQIEKYEKKLAKYHEKIKALTNPNDEFLLTLCQKLARKGPPRIVITGLERSDTLENYVYEDGSTPTVITSPKIGPYRSGTGDVFSAIVVGDAVNGKSFTDSIRHAVSFITKVMKETVKRESPLTDGICFEEFLCEL